MEMSKSSARAIVILVVVGLLVSVVGDVIVSLTYDASHDPGRLGVAVDALLFGAVTLLLWFIAWVACIQATLRLRQWAWLAILGLPPALFVAVVLMAFVLDAGHWNTSAQNSGAAVLVVLFFVTPVAVLIYGCWMWACTRKLEKITHGGPRPSAIPKGPPISFPEE